jgi:Tudor domain
MIYIQQLFETTKINDIFEPRVGQACLVQSSQIWYRATVQSVDEDKCTLLLVDYGYEVEEEHTNVAKLPAVLASMPPMAHRCTLDTIEFVDKGMQSKFLYDFSKERFPVRVVFKEFIKDKRLSVRLLNFDGDDFIQVIGHRFRSQFGQFKPTNEQLIIP